MWVLDSNHHTIHRLDEESQRVSYELLTQQLENSPRLECFLENVIISTVGRMGTPSARI